MRKSITKIVTTLEGQLGKIHTIVNQIDKKSIQSIRDLSAWLLRTEKVYQELNLAEVSKFSVKRALLSSFIPTGDRNKKKEHLQLAANLLAEAQQDLWETYSMYAKKIETAGNGIQQLLGLIYQTKEFKYDPADDFTLFINQIWNFCCNHEQLKPLTIQISSELNRADILRLLADKIALEKL